MQTRVLPLRRVGAASVAAVLSLGLLAVTGTAATGADPDPTVASGPDWTVTQAAGGYEVTLELDEPLPMVDDAPTLVADGVDLGIATESADGLSLSVLTTDPGITDADDVEMAWASGDVSKVEPTNSPVTSVDEPVEPAKAAKLAAKAARAAARAAGDDGATPGPYSYLQDDYDYGDQAIPMAGIGGIRGELTGRVYLPVGVTGPMPTIVLLHGRHSSCASVPGQTGPTATWPCATPRQTEVPSYKGYDGTGQTLATWGYAVISISANAINANDANLTVDNGALARGQLVLDSLEMIKKWNAGDPAVYHDNAKGTDFGIQEALDAAQADVGTTDLNQLNAADLVGKFDLDNVGLMGHSRGGEGVTMTVNLNQALAQPFGIKSVLPLAPVDFTRMTVGHTPMLLMLPYCDGDVSNQQGQHFVDDSRYAYDDDVLVSTVWVMGANHNFFNTVWTPGKYAYSTSDDWGATSTDTACGPLGAGNIRLTADQQYNVGTAYMSAWFRLTVGSGGTGDTGFLDMFDGSIKPVLTSVPTADVRVLASAPADDRVDIERFTDFNGKVRLAGSGVVNVCASASGRTVPQLLPFCGTTSTLRSTSAMPHWTPASYAPNVPASPMTKFLWTSTSGSTAASIRITVPAAARNAAAHDALVFKTAPDESVLTGTDMTMTVVDSAGATWSSLVSALNPLAIKRMPIGASTTGTPNTTLNKIVLQQVSIPIASMTGINTSDIREVRFAGAIGADTLSTGGVYLSDLALADSSVGTPEVLTAAPTINVDPTTAEEGNISADTKSVAVVLSKPASTTTSTWFTLIGSATATSKGWLSATKVTFAPGETCKAVEVPTLGDVVASSTPTTSYKTAVSNQTDVVFGNKAFGTLRIREDDGLIAPATPPGAPVPAAVPEVGVQGDVCAEYAAKSQVFSLAVANAKPAPGTTVAVTGTGFRNGESVSFTDESTTPATVLGTAIANAAGTAVFDWAVPTGVTLGAHSLKGVGAGTGRTATGGLTVKAPTTTSMVMDPIVPAIGQSLTLTATVTGQDTTGTVEFLDGATSLGSAAVTGGEATLTLPGGFAAGSHSLSSSFGETGTATGSPSNLIAFTLTKGGSATLIGLSDASTTYGEGATGTVIVGGGTGSVTLTGPEGTSVLPLDGSGTATFALPAGLAPGSYPLSVEYAGTPSVAASSASATYKVTKAAAVTTVDVVKFKEAKKNKKKASVKLDVGVTGVSGVAAPSGTITVTWGKVTKTVPASSAVTLTLKKTKGKTAGQVTVSYSGDGSYTGTSTSETVL